MLVIILFETVIIPRNVQNGVAICFV